MPKKDAATLTAPDAPLIDVPFSVATVANVNDAVDPVFLALSARKGLVAREVHAWPLDDETLTVGDVVERIGAEADETLSTMHYRRSSKVEVLARMDGALVNVQLTQPSRLWVSVAARTADEATAAMDRILSLFPDKKDQGDQPTVPVAVWTKDSGEPLRRLCDARPWVELERNYAPHTRDQLAALMDPGFEAGKGGKLILLHGAPGTGKSTALSTLAWQWRTWAELHYVADPAAFLTDPEYLFQVSLGRRADERWRVVLIEDAGGLFAPDAKQHAGEDRLGRLLNATDGMLGHSSKALFILTTNEPLSSFHAAMSRPGRCSAAVEFLPMDEATAKAWLEEQERPDLAVDVDGERTLAELYALLNGTRIEERPKQHVGFRAGAA